MSTVRRISRHGRILILAPACAVGSVALLPSPALADCPKQSPKAAASPAPSRPRVVDAMVWNPKSDSYSLARVNALTLRQRGRPMDIGTQQQGWLRIASPTGRHLAVGGSRKNVTVIDLSTRRVIADIDVGRPQHFLDWLPSGLIGAVIGAPGEGKPKWSLLIDPAANEVVARQRLDGEFIAAQVTDSSIVVVTTQYDPPLPPVRGTTVLWSLDVSEAFSLQLPGIDSGVREREPNSDEFSHYDTPGLAVDPRARRAWVFATNGGVAEVNLYDSSASYSTLTGPPPALTIPSADAKLANFDVVRGAYLANGLIAIYGHDQRFVPRPRRRMDTKIKPYGVVLFDPAERRACILDRNADSLVLSEDAMLVFREVARGPNDGIGVRAYDLAGRPLWHRFGTDVIDTIQVVDGLAYVTSSWHGWRTEVVEVATGRVIRTVRGRPPDLISAH